MGGAWPRETLATFGSTGTGVLVLQRGRGGVMYFRGGNDRCHCFNPGVADKTGIAFGAKIGGQCLA